MQCPFCEATISFAVESGEGIYVTGCSECLNAVGVDVQRTPPNTLILPGCEDIRATTPADSLGGAVLKLLRDDDGALPVLPEVSCRIIDVMNDEDSSMRDLSRVVSEDAAIAVNVLKVANSATYGGLQEIRDLDAACTRLGQRTVANIAQAVASEGLFTSEDPAITELMKKLWLHSVAVAYFSGELGRLLSLPDYESLYLQGLFHDIGKLAILSVLATDASLFEGQGTISGTVTKEVLEAYHQISGIHLLNRWKLPASFLVTAYYHEEPERTPANEALRSVHVVALANELAYASGLGFGDNGDHESVLDHPSAAFLNLSDIKLAGVRVDLEEKLGSLISALDS